jgi:hypothetical protein
VFEGGGFGVAVTVAPREVAPYPVEFLPPGVSVRPTRLGELMPVAARTDAELALELRRVQQMEARLAAYTAELVSELAARRPDTLDRQIGQPGAAAPDWAPGPGREAPAGVSEFFADELAMILHCSRTAATKLADTAVLLLQRLPATWAALADGRLGWPRARALAAELLEPAREVAPGVLAEVEAAVLPRAAQLSIRGLQAAVRSGLLRRDAAAADRRRAQAERAADVVLRPARDGMAELRAFMPAPLAAAVRGAVDTYARMAKKAGDPRPIGQLRVGVLGDLVLRPWDTSRPPVTAHLTVLAPLDTLATGAAGSDGCAAGSGACAVGHGMASAAVPGAVQPSAGLPGEVARIGGCGCAEPLQVDGQPITAAHLCALLEQLDALCPGGLQAPAGGSLDIVLTDPRSGALRATVTRAELERLARRGCPQHPHDRCGCPLLDRPPPVDSYSPTPALRRFATTRDRTCRHPGCGNHAGWADLDHVVAHAAGGDTSCENLCCLCRRHHRLKTHAPGWRFVMDDDGVLTVTTPSGVTRVTRPPGLADPPEVHAPSQPEHEPAPF